ncbi:DUF3344 domain-containing protein, partial [archaeon]|nr:DUF3344 domain-containing protein [archaeon]
MNRAFIFTMDAVLALIPVFILVGTVSTFSGGVMIHMQSQSMEMAHRSVDIMAVLEKQGMLDDFGLMFANYTKLRNESDASWTVERNNLLVLINATLNPMIPEQMGYGVDFLGVYANGTEYTDLEFTSDNRTLTGPTQRPYENESESIDVGFKLVSGYEKERPITGCIARASIVDMSKTTKKVISINPQGGGWSTNDVDIETRFEIPADANITNATLYISMHYDPPITDITTLEVNNNDIKSDIVTIDTQSLGALGTGFFGLADVTSHVTIGTNVIDFSFTNTGSWHAHTHPGMRLEVT